MVAQKFNNKMKNKITPYGLLKLAKLLHKNRKNEEQWLRVAKSL